MATGLDLLENLEALDPEAVAIEVLEENTNVMADLIAGQLAQGLRSDGSEILPSYAPLTIELKKNKSGLAGVTDHVTLFDTGSHYEKLYTEVKGDELEYGSKDNKSAGLQEKYDRKGKSSKGSIYGLTEDSKDDLTGGHTEPQWQKKIEAKTGLKFK
jgi:hypothetical protein